MYRLVLGIKFCDPFYDFLRISIYRTRQLDSCGSKLAFFSEDVSRILRTYFSGHIKCILESKQLLFSTTSYTFLKLTYRPRTQSLPDCRRLFRIYYSIIYLDISPWSRFDSSFIIFNKYFLLITASHS